MEGLEDRIEEENMADEGKKRKRNTKGKPQDESLQKTKPAKKKKSKKEKKERKQKIKEPKTKKQQEAEPAAENPTSTKPPKKKAKTNESSNPVSVQPLKNFNIELKSNINAGINFDQFEDIPVSVSTKEFGSISAFSECPLGDGLQSIITKIGYAKPTPVQKHALPIIMAGKDLMASAQTGSGKTAAFMFPIIASLLKKDFRQGKPKTEGFGRYTIVYPLALVLAPTRELASQIYEEARKFTTYTKIVPVVVYGGVPYTPQARSVEQGVDILIATPGRLKDMMDRGKVSLSQVQFLCLDEADQMLDMGFEPQIREIVQQRDMPKERRTVMFSATFPKEIRKLATDFLVPDHVTLKVGRVGSTTQSIVQKIKFVEKGSEKMGLLTEEIKALDKQGRTMVFVGTKKSAAFISAQLQRAGFRAACIHGDCTQEERERALKSFKVGRINVLIGTSVAARGLDIDNVSQVINYDLPSCIDDYVHRIGRTGRAGNVGLATAFFTPDDKGLAKPLLRVLKESAQEVPPQLLQFVSSPARLAKGRRWGTGGAGGAWGRRTGGAGSWGRGRGGMQRRGGARRTFGGR